MGDINSGKSTFPNILVFGRSLTIINVGQSWGDSILSLSSQHIVYVMFVRHYIYYICIYLWYDMYTNINYYVTIVALVYCMIHFNKYNVPI